MSATSRAARLALMIAALAAATPSRAVVTIDLPNACNDRNSLRDIAIDAQLNAVKLYYKGLIQGAGDKNKQACLETHVLLDGEFAVINKTRDLVVSKCLAIDVAARMALQDICP